MLKTHTKNKMAIPPEKKTHEKKIMQRRKKNCEIKLQVVHSKKTQNNPSLDLVHFMSKLVIHAQKKKIQRKFD